MKQIELTATITVTTFTSEDTAVSIALYFRNKNMECPTWFLEHEDMFTETEDFSDDVVWDDNGTFEFMPLKKLRLIRDGLNRMDELKNL